MYIIPITFGTWSGISLSYMQTHTLTLKRSYFCAELWSGFGGDWQHFYITLNNVFILRKTKWQNWMYDKEWRMYACMRWPSDRQISFLIIIFIFEWTTIKSHFFWDAVICNFLAQTLVNSIISLCNNTNMWQLTQCTFKKKRGKTFYIDVCYHSFSLFKAGEN